MDEKKFEKQSVSEVFGQIVWLMTQSGAHRSLFLSDLEWSVMPAILGKRFKIFYHESQPKAVVFWALVSPEVAGRLAGDETPRLRINEWNSGDIPIVVDAVAPFGDRDALKREFLAELKTGLAKIKP